MSQTTTNMTPVAPAYFAAVPATGSSVACGGLGRYWNIDPIILRVAFGVSLLVGASASSCIWRSGCSSPDDQAPPNVKYTPNWGLRILDGLGWTPADRLALVARRHFRFGRLRIPGPSLPDRSSGS